MAAQFILYLKDQYNSQSSLYNPNALSLNVDDHKYDKVQFIGANALTLNSDNKIVREAPSILAADTVTMVAKKAICLGAKGQKTEVSPFRLYAPTLVTIKTGHLKIGDLWMIVEPDKMDIACEKLTLLGCSEDDNPPHFDIIKKWVEDKDIEIQTRTSTN